ncbi:MAG TPA: triose-phosphate isomerase [Dissulfurispiraceae bacterium]|nr:triose-phosphate isomerase [Dissulfurispiraceae bacterium]
MRKPLIAANWKMNKTISETQAFLDAFLPAVSSVTDVDVIIAPPFTSLAAASEKMKNSAAKLAAQDVFFEEKGAFTGEVSAAMLIDAGCEAVIIGHSERRHILKESDEVINKKVRAARAHGLEVLFCIGELLAERESGKTMDVLKTQVMAGLSGVAPDGIIVAYEPVWAIGTGKTATPEQAQEAHAFVRELLAGLFGDAAQTLRILYGGSVTPENIGALMSQPDLDGALVGGASLKPDSFAQLVRFKK